MTDRFFYRIKLRKEHIQVFRKPKAIKNLSIIPGCPGFCEAIRVSSPIFTLYSFQLFLFPHRSLPALHPAAHPRSPAAGRVLRVCSGIGCRVLLLRLRGRCGGRVSCWRWSKWYEELIRLFKSDNSKLTDENQE